MFEFEKNKFKRFWKLVGELSMKKDVFFNASAITFNLFTCAVPFTLIIISILGYILSIDAAFSELVRYGRELLPQFSFETQSGDVFEGAVTIEALIQPLVGARQIFGIAGIIILMFFAQGLFHTLKHVLFEVFDIKDRKSAVMELVYNFFAFGVVGGVFIFFTMAVSFISLFSFDDYAIPYTEIVIEFGWISDWLTGIVPILFTFVLFYVIYRYISERRMNAKVAFVAALLYTLLFELAKSGVSIYLEYAFTAYRFYYQGYAALLIIGLWAFYTAALFVITSIMARAFQEVYLEQAPAIEKNPYTAIS
ncbi:YihY/virulence factor BrkB family protein [Rhodohalobacter sp. 614A]|uniref:YihY/virulence factor BrkB family protein n=1 Tax=Rhodohalobacter sp. 614A TaxID=2908649 RepID=UPI001F3EA658|nr:YihY/virulence factor BrkB family protein [Rhodohalobacter sp. 614A]